VFFSTVGLLGLVFAGFVTLVLVLRIVRRSRRRRFDAWMDVDFSMAELREMQTKGLVTEAEAERLKQTVLARAEAREAQRLEALSEKRPLGAPGFQVIQSPPPVPPLAEPAPPAPPASPAPPDDQSRDAR
jgi:hypothetical protein